MSNLDLTIAEIMHGDTQVLKIMKGDIKKWPLATYTVTTTLTNITSDAPATALENSSLVVNLYVNTGHYMDNSSVVVMMGSTDITSTAYSNGVVTIASVTGNVSITASTMFDAQVEYLQGDRTAYINTGVKITSKTKFDIDLSIGTPPSSSYYYLFGGRVSSANGEMRVFRNSSGNWKWYFGANNTTIACADDRVRIQNLEAARKVYINSKAGAVASQTFTTDVDFLLFAAQNGDSITSKAPMLLYSCKLYNTTTDNLLRDYIPVRKNDIGYLYDKVSGELFGNVNSTGAFTYGNDV